MLPLPALGKTHLSTYSLVLEVGRGVLEKNWDKKRNEAMSPTLKAFDRLRKHTS